MLSPPFGGRHSITFAECTAEIERIAESGDTGDFLYGPGRLFQQRFSPFKADLLHEFFDGYAVAIPKAPEQRNPADTFQRGSGFLQPAAGRHFMHHLL
jgi:hypothetical protein